MPLLPLSAMMGAGGSIIVLFWYVNHLRDVEVRSHAEENGLVSAKLKKEKPKMSLKESLVLLSKSR
jgi:ATP/ADP translocase